MYTYIHIHSHASAHIHIHTRTEASMRSKSKHAPPTRMPRLKQDECVRYKQGKCVIKYGLLHNIAYCVII